MQLEDDADERAWTRCNQKIMLTKDDRRRREGEERGGGEEERELAREAHAIAIFYSRQRNNRLIVMPDNRNKWEGEQ